MPSGLQPVRMVFNGGWATDFGPTAEVGLSQSGLLGIPFLVDAENVVYELDGGPRKIPGSTKVNETALEGGTGSADEIRGIFDYWKQGTSASPVQKRVIHVGTLVMADAADGVFVDIGGGTTFEDDKVPCYSQFEDKVIVSNDSTTDVPQIWDQTGTLAALTGLGGAGPDRFAFHTHHKNRLWAAGNPAFPDRLYYSALLDPNDFNGAGSGQIDMDPGDGDRITGLASHKNELLVFKGPYTGSIHRITGSAPTGSDSFSRVEFIHDVGSVNHNSIFKFRDDVGFVWSDGSVRSLNATAAFGDYTEGALSRPIDGELARRINNNAIQWASSVDHSAAGRVLIGLPVDGSSSVNLIVMMDYRFEVPRWAPWPIYSATRGGFLAMARDGSGPAIPMLGGNDGFVRNLNSPNRSIDGVTSIPFKATLPYLNFGNPQQRKTLSWASMGLAPKGNYNATFGWQRDTEAQQTDTVSQSGADVLAGPVTQAAILSFVDLGSGLVRVTSAAVHSKSVGDVVVITNTTNFNGTYSLQAVGVLTFDIISAPAATETGTWQSAAETNPFVLGTSTLGGALFSDRFMDLEEGGEFRSIQIQVTQTSLNQDIELHTIALGIAPGSHSLENT